MKLKALAGGHDYFSTGEGDRVVVFVHGFLDAESVWDDVIREMALPGTQAVQVDLAGMGGRLDDTGPITLERFAEEVGAVIDAIGKPFVIVGQSMGAQVAELVAVRRPDQAKGLVLLSPVPLGGVGLTDDALEAFRSLGGRNDAQIALRRQLTAAFSSESFDRLVALGFPVRPDVVAASAKVWNVGHPAGQEPSTFTGPVLIARGAQDSFVTDTVLAGAVAPRFVAAQIETIEGAGHWPHAERSETVARLLEAFLDSIAWTGRLVRTAEGVRGQGWTRAFANKTEDSFADAFNPRVTLQASVLVKAVEGAAQVKAVMAAASKIYESLTFTHEAVNANRTYLEWEAVAFQGKALLGVTVLEKDADGKILNVAIHHRPLGAALQFSAALRDGLVGVVDTSHFHVGA